MNQVIQIPTVSKEFERIEFSAFDTSKSLNVINLPDGGYIEYEKQPYGYISRFAPNDSYFRIIKQFYSDGKIKEKGVIFNSGYFQIGTWYYFDEQAHLIKEENDDHLYKYSFEDLLDFLQKQKISVTKGNILPYSGIHTTIRKEMENNEPVWVVRWLKKPLLIEEIVINGISGKIIRTNEIKRKEG